MVDFSREDEPRRSTQTAKSVMHAWVILITEEIADASGE